MDGFSGILSINLPIKPYTRFVEWRDQTTLKQIVGSRMDRVQWLTNREVEKAPKPVLILRYTEESQSFIESRKMGILQTRLHPNCMGCSEGEARQTQLILFKIPVMSGVNK